MQIAAATRESEAAQPVPIKESRMSVVHHHLTIGPTSGGPGSQAALAFVAGLILSVMVVILILAGLTAVYFRSLGRIEGYVEAVASQSEALDRRMQTAEVSLGLRPAADIAAADETTTDEGENP